MLNQKLLWSKYGFREVAERRKASLNQVSDDLFVVNGSKIHLACSVVHFYVIPAKGKL
jgi:hypothetical protein